MTHAAVHSCGVARDMRALRAHQDASIVRIIQCASATGQLVFCKEIKRKKRRAAR